jgi:hypothetical protein
MTKRWLLMVVVLVSLVGIQVALAQGTPEITAFSSSISQVEAAGLNNRTLLVPVVWETASRPANSNLIFEQVLPDGRVMNIELPRIVPIVPSAGVGVVNPFPPGEGIDSVVLRLSLVDLRNGRTLDQAELIIPIGESTIVTPSITSFATRATEVSRQALERNQVFLPVSWSLENRPENSNLVFEQIFEDGSVTNIELPRSSPIIPSAGNGVVAPRAPQSASTEAITLRLTLVDLGNSNSVITQREIQLPVVVSTQPPPSIRSFSTVAQSIGLDALQNRSARINVSWQVDNRPENSNLIFEQVLGEGNMVNVELPRRNPFVSSQGNGIVAPVSPLDANSSITLQLRLVDLTTQQTLLSETIEVTVTRPAPTPTPLPPGPLAIRSFSTTATSVSRASLQNQSARLPVSWDVQNRPANSNLVFEQILDNGQAVNVELPRQVVIVPSTGIGVVAPRNVNSAQVTLRLRIVDLGNQNTLAEQQIIVQIDAPQRVTIRTFNTTSGGIARAALTARSARVPVTWEIQNRPENSNLIFEQVLDNNTVVNVELPRTVPIVPSSGRGETAPVAPLNVTTGSITLRLRVVDLATQTTLSQQTVNVPIIESGNAPVIRSFTSSATQVDSNSLANRSARVAVSWQVDNRPQNSNLVFEQVLDNNTVVNVELPRSNPFVSSSGNGVVAPVAPVLPTTASVTFRLRLINLANNNSTLLQSEITIPISGRTAPTATPVAPDDFEPTPTPESLPGGDGSGGTGSPIDGSFTVSEQTIERNGGVTINWSLTGPVERVQIGRLSEYGGTLAETLADDQPASGSLETTVPADYIQSVTFQLIAFTSAGQETLLTSTATIACPFTEKLDATLCPITQSAGVNTAFQAFERGSMVWRGDTQTIYVLYADGSWQQFNDEWVEGTANPNTETPPEGRIKPERGFGVIWNELGGSSVLGWATTPEVSYAADWEIYQIVDAGNVALGPQFTLPDGRVAALGLVWQIR